MGRYIMEIQSWRELLRPYELAVDELNVKFNHIRQEHIESGLYSPIEQVAGRVKTVSSILEAVPSSRIKARPHILKMQQFELRFSNFS